MILQFGDTNKQGHFTREQKNTQQEVNKKQNVIVNWLHKFRENAK